MTSLNHIEAIILPQVPADGMRIPSSWLNLRGWNCIDPTAIAVTTAAGCAAAVLAGAVGAMATVGRSPLNVFGVFVLGSRPSKQGLAGASLLFWKLTALL